MEKEITFRSPHVSIKVVRNTLVKHSSRYDKQFDATNTIAIIDFLNLTRKEISHRPAAKFVSLKDFVNTVQTIAMRIKRMGDFKRIYIVTKSFNFNNQIKYSDVPMIIIWAFFQILPEWINKLFLVLVNGINGSDKEADDRALFILYDEISKATTGQVVILSNDNFSSLRTQFYRKVVLNFYSVKNIGKTWKSTRADIRYSIDSEQTVQSDLGSEYDIIHPAKNEYTRILIRS